MAHDIFISYSHVDKPVADAICAHMESEGLRCWYAPRDIVPGANWADSIIQAIGATKVMVLIFTRDSNVSPQVLREVSNAVSSGVTIVPFRLTDEEPIAGMKYYLSTVHWLDAMNTKREEAIAQLGVLCKAIVANAGAGKPATAMNEAQTEVYQQKASEAAQSQGGKKKQLGLWIGIAAAVLLATTVAHILEAQNEKTFQSLNEVNDDTSQSFIRQKLNVLL